MEAEFKKGLYDYYENVVYKVKGYDYPAMYAAGRKRRGNPNGPRAEPHAFGLL